MPTQKWIFLDLSLKIFAQNVADAAQTKMPWCCLSWESRSFELCGPHDAALLSGHQLWRTRFQIHRREWHVRGGRTICLGGRWSWLFVFSILHSLNGCYILNIERWLCVRHVALRTRKYRWAGARVKERNWKGSHGLRSMSSSIGASSVFQWLWVLLCLALDWLCFIFTE